MVCHGYLIIFHKGHCINRFIKQAYVMEYDAMYHDGHYKKQIQDHNSQL
jgi:hypothetical protein